MKVRPFARTLFIWLLALTFAPMAARSADVEPVGPKRPPNILIILADDLGYHDLGFQGGKDVRTPHLDALAAGGVRFSDGHVSCPVCSPTRAGLLTGRYQQRFGHELNPGPALDNDPNFGLPLTETTLAAHLKTVGYHTGIVGKWHLGFAPQFQPTARGFDEFFGFLPGAHKYLDPSTDPRSPIYRNTEVVEEKEYLTDAFAREAVSFVERNSDSPFLLYLAFNAVHNPAEVKQKYLERFSHIHDPQRRTYAAILSALDDAVGAVIAKLREKVVEENTLIFFLSDNGGPSPAAGKKGNFSSNEPLHGRKSQLYEGGIRVPFVVRWKGHLPEGKTFDRPVISLDIVPTVLAAAGLPMSGDDKPLDGVNLLPYVTGEKTGVPHNTLYWRYGADNAAIRDGNWKLIKAKNAPAELYDMGADRAETDNLASASPTKVAELSEKLAAWEAQLENPRWGPQPRDAEPNLRPAESE